MDLEKSKAETDALFYRDTKEIVANQLMLSKAFLRWEAVRAITNSTDVFLR